MASTETPSKIKLFLNIDNMKLEFENPIKKSNNLLDKINKVLIEDNKTKDVQNDINNIEELEKSLCYLKFLQNIEDISNEMETSMDICDDESMISLYINLVDISYQIELSSCKNLLHYVCETLHFWHNILKDKLSNEYMDILKTLKWPFCSKNASAIVTQLPDTITRFKILTEYLLQLQLPNEKHGPTVKSSLLTDFTPVCLPISLLIRPLKQRFIYHFSGNKQTNRRDKPEWFFTQILTWIKDHEKWIDNNVQPVIDASGFSHIYGKIEFMRGLVQLAVEKLYSELQIVQYDDALFGHFVDEALGFERELRDTLLYPSNQPATVFVLTQAQIFSKWINMEKKYATEKMDSILSASTAWQKIDPYDTDEMKITECADGFLTLLITICDRYKHLPQPGHRLQFLELQLELIDDWRVRLLQLLHQEHCHDPLKSLIPKILNSLNYVSSVLIEWGVTVHYLQLNFFKNKRDAVEAANALSQDDIIIDNEEDENSTIFDDAIGLLKRLENELINEICESIFMDIKAKSKTYIIDKWFSMQNEKQVSSLSLTQSGCLMFQELSLKLHDLHQVLALPIFKSTCKIIAKKLDNYLFNELVLNNKFNVGGAAQLKFDITKNLFTLFGIYCIKPESYFPLMRESCILLNTLLGSAMLMIEAFYNDDDENNGKEILADIGVYKMSIETALMVLHTRTDIGM